ncbi:MAG: GNAT family N-acetyltransferase [Anaerolineae bacterium]|nr:GNAT family N-acetyltransferase [Anaerolineae bacterium]
MEMRELNISELDDLLDLYSHLHDADDPLPERVAVEAVWREIQESPHFRYFGLFVNGQLVSSCTLSIMPNLTRGCRPYGVIENVVTHTDYRHQGHGSAVLRYALDYAWSKDCYKVMLLTGRKSEAVYRFYEAVGFDGQAKQAFLAKPE